MVTNDMPANARAMVARYRQVWREVQGAAAPPKMGVVRFIVVADSDAKAMAIARRAYLRWRSSFTLSVGTERHHAGLAAARGQLR